MSQIALAKRCRGVSAPDEAIVEMSAPASHFDLDAIFRVQYQRIARVIARVVRDPARAEELAVEVFLKLSRNRDAQGEQAPGWLYRTALRMSLDELRRQARRARFERLSAWLRGAPTPEEVYEANEEQGKVRKVLSVMDRRSAELLLLRSHGLSYAEIAAALRLNPSSVGTLLSRSEKVFRKEYVSRYGHNSFA